MTEKRFALADTPKGAAVLIYDDQPQATPLDDYDVTTCPQRHERMMAYQAQRTDELWVAFTDARLRIAHLEDELRKMQRTIQEWSADA